MTLEGTLAAQTFVANYNRISTSLAETPETWRPRFARRNAVPSIPSTGRLPSCSPPILLQGSGARSTWASPPLQRRPSPSASTHAQARQSGPHLNPASVKQGYPCGARDTYSQRGGTEVDRYGVSCIQSNTCLIKPRVS